MKNLDLRRNIKRGRRLVEDGHIRFRHQSHGCDRALKLAAGYFVRIPLAQPLRVRQSEIGEQPVGSFALVALRGRKIAYVAQSAAAAFNPAHRRALKDQFEKLR
jgi:hypothetical protein